MEMMVILIRQVLQMFLLVLVGAMLFRTGKISREGSKSLGNILIYISLPCVIINSFRIERTPERIRALFISAAVAAVLLLVSILISRICFRNDPVAHFASSFSNPGLFGVPLIVAALGQEAVFYTAGFIAFLNLAQWTYGVSLLTGQPLSQGLSLKRLAKAPFIIAIAIGLILFFTGAELPSLLSGCLGTVTAINTPIAMFTLGVYLAQTDLRAMVKRVSLYKLALVRLLVIPAVSLLLLALLPASLQGMKLALLLVAACPVGSNVAVYSQLHGADYPYAVETVIVSTILSLPTIPVFAWLSELVWTVSPG